MVNPDFLRQYYFPTVRLSIEPLLDAGVRLIHHCDGDVRPLIDDFLSLGFSGLQGFQYELGIHPYDLRHKLAMDGRPLLFFASLSVSRTLPFGTPDDVRREVDWWHALTDGGRGMFLFTSNVTGPEVPPENLLAGYHRAHRLKPDPTLRAQRVDWPWLKRDPDNVAITDPATG
jgi:uroporphyrinogen decarboxylase